MPETPEQLAAILTDRSRIERKIGQGGMATVYLADDLKHERKVALKVLRPELGAVAHRAEAMTLSRDYRRARTAGATSASTPGCIAW